MTGSRTSVRWSEQGQDGDVDCRASPWLPFCADDSSQRLETAHARGKGTVDLGRCRFAQGLHGFECPLLQRRWSVPGGQDQQAVGVVLLGMSATRRTAPMDAAGCATCPRKPEHQLRTRPWRWGGLLQAVSERRGRWYRGHAGWTSSLVSTCPQTTTARSLVGGGIPVLSSPGEARRSRDGLITLIVLQASTRSTRGASCQGNSLLGMHSSRAAGDRDDCRRGHPRARVVTRGVQRQLMRHGGLRVTGDRV